MSNRNKSGLIEEAARLLANAEKAVILTGAGVSAESGVPTFRGKDGLWKNYRAQELATPEAFEKNPALVWEWYGYRQQLVKKCSPNRAHQVLSLLESLYEDFTLITQNVDGLHRKAKSRRILELHGCLFQARCTKEGTVLDFELSSDPLPRCSCGALLRPHIVWFGESLDPVVIGEAFLKASRCDVMLVLGTSGVVQPAASLPLAAVRSGADVIEINPEETPISSLARVFINMPAAVAMDEIYRVLHNMKNSE